MMETAASSGQRQRLRQANSNDIPSAAKISLTHDERSRAAADIKREIHERVKNDWESEWAAIVRKTRLPRRVGDDNHEDGDGDRGGEGDGEGDGHEDGDEDDGSIIAVVDDDGTGPTSWQEREYSSSPCPSPPPSATATTAAAEASLSSAAAPGLKFSQTGRDGGEPLASRVTTTGADHAREERLKRRRLLEEEMSWNTGLRYWMMQRDSWCGARLRHVRHSPSAAAPSPVTAPAAFEDENGDNDDTNDDTNDDDATTMSSADDLATDGSPPPSPIRRGQRQWLQRRRRRQQQPELRQEEQLQPKPRPVADIIEEVSITPPLFPPSNPLRAGVTPALYPQIYSKFVIKSQTPIVPINLAHMLRAIVAGWQSEGKWPARAASDPQHGSNRDDTSTTMFASSAAAAAASPAAAGAREPQHGFLPAVVRRSTLEGGRSASRWLMNGSGRKGSLDEAKDGGRSASARPRRLAMSRGVGAVKKVLGLVGTSTSRGCTLDGHHDDS